MTYEVLVFISGSLFAITGLTAFVAYSTKKSLEHTIAEHDESVNKIINSKAEEMLAINKIHSKLVEDFVKQQVEISNLKQEVTGIKNNRSFKL